MSSRRPAAGSVRPDSCAAGAPPRPAGPPARDRRRRPTTPSRTTAARRHPADERGTPMAARTWDGSIAPLLHAEAADAHTPARSSRNRSASLSTPSMHTWADPAVFRSRGTVSTKPGTRSSRPSTRRSRMARMLAHGVVARRGGHPHRLGHRDDAGDVERAAAAVSLLPAAHQEGLDGRPAAHDERADALRSAELVGRDGDEVAAGHRVRQVEPLEALDGVRVDEGLGTARRAPAPRRRPAARWCRPRCSRPSRRPAGRPGRARRPADRDRPRRPRRPPPPGRRGAPRRGARRGARPPGRPRLRHGGGSCRARRGCRPPCHSP